MTNGDDTFSASSEMSPVLSFLRLAGLCVKFCLLTTILIAPTKYSDSSIYYILF